MNWTAIIQTLLTGTLPAILTYIATNQRYKVKLLEIEKVYELKVKELETKNETLKSEHAHQLEVIKLQSQTNKDETMNTALASILPGLLNQILTGQIDANKIKQLSKDFKG